MKGCLQTVGFGVFVIFGLITVIALFGSGDRDSAASATGGAQTPQSFEVDSSVDLTHLTASMSSAAAKQNEPKSLLFIPAIKVSEVPTATPLPTATPDPTLPRTDFDARLACMVTEEFVTPKLKSPSTAVYGSFEEACRAYFDAGVWTIRNYVDSQNGFGAMLRTGYVATLTYTADDKMWHLQDLVFSER